MRLPILLSLVTALTFQFSQGQPFALRSTQMSATGISMVTSSHPYPPLGTRGLFIYNPDTTIPSAHITILGPDFAWTPGTPNQLDLSPTMHTTLASFATTAALNAWGSTVQGEIDTLESSMAPVATSGAYADLTGKPSLFDGQYSSLTGLPTLFSGNYADLLGLPSLFSGAYADLTGKPALFSGAYADLTGKPTLFSGAYGDLTGLPTLFDGQYSSLSGAPTNLSSFTNGPGYLTASALSPYVTSASLTTTLGSYATTAALGTKFNVPSGTTAQYLRGDGSTATFPSIPAAQVNADWTANSGVSQILNKPTIPAAQVQSDWNAVSGLGQILNKPTLTSGTVTSVGVTSSNLTVTGSPVTSSGSIAVSLPNTGTAGTYGLVTTDAQGRVTAGKRTETYSGTTNASGLYTVTFGTAYAAAPNIQANLINGADNQNLRITAISTTGFTVLARTRVDVIGLLPTWNNANGLAVDVLINEK